MNPYIEKLRWMVLYSMKKEPVRIFLFGSWAKGTQHHSSDVDIAVEYKEKYNPRKIASLRDDLEESTIPYRVDVVDMREASLSLKQEILKDGILWKN